MSRAKAFKKADVTRAVQAVEEAGHRVTHVEVDKAGKIIMAPADDQMRDVKPHDFEAEWQHQEEVGL
jgi:hypothetical protein